MSNQQIGTTRYAREMEDKIYNFIREYKMLNGGCAPEFREIAEAVNLKSPTGLRLFINGLVARGLVLQMKEKRARYIRLRGERYTPPLDPARVEETVERITGATARATGEPDFPF